MDTVALLAWTAASLEDGDKHSLATSVRPLTTICGMFLISNLLLSQILSGLGSSAGTDREK